MTHDTDAIKRDHPIADIVGQAISLKKSGNEFKGLCPFHPDKNPSFYVVPDKEFAHCFGCGWGGDVIKFVMDFKQIDFIEAVRMLAGDKGEMDQSPEAKAERSAAIEKRRKDEERYRQRAIKEAVTTWDNASPADHHHPYLVRKQVPPHTLRQDDHGNLVLPVFGPDGEIQSIQRINDKGDKLFLAGAPMALGRMMIGINMGRTILCEGYATGASIYEAVPDQICVTFSMGNMEKVAREMADDGKSCILAADTGTSATRMTALGQELGFPVVVPTTPTDFNDMAASEGVDAVADLFRATLREYADRASRIEDANRVETGPVDLWAQPSPPVLPRGILPKIIERFAFYSAEQIGTDPAALAMCAVSSCAAMISDDIKLQPKRNEKGWQESARLWIMLVGPPSARKSPAMSRATSRIKKLDTEMLYEGNRALAEWQEEGGPKSGLPKPPTPRLRIGDATTEAAQEVCRESPDGVLLIQDELSGLFGRIDKYGGKGGGADRSFWLEAYGGGQYAVNRIGRGSFIIENLSINILGGIQPEKVRSVIAGADDDGMIQRFIPVVLRPTDRDKDVEAPMVADEYGDVLEALHRLKAPENFFGKRPLEFSEGARAIREKLADEHFHFVRVMEGVNTKFSSHVGKYDGLFPRLCVVWHCVEHVERGGDEPLPFEISEATAERVARFLREFVMAHARVFYGSVASVDLHDDVVRAVGGWILSHSIERFTLRDLTRNVRQFKLADEQVQERVVHILESYGWAEPDPKRQQHRAWDVPREVHQSYVEKAEAERIRRADVRELIAEAVSERRGN